jgi:hypothetical protein
MGGGFVVVVVVTVPVKARRMKRRLPLQNLKQS